MSQDSNIENCNSCGKCNMACPVYNAHRTEVAGPRFKVWLAKKNSYNEVFQLCTLCGACSEACPASVKIDILKIRRQLARQGKEHASNREMRRSIIEHGHPYYEKKGKHTYT